MSPGQRWQPWQLTCLPALLALLVGLPAAAQTTVYVGFGDSITFGVGDDPDRPEAGYTPRLQALLTDAGVDAEVVNEGVGGERTPEGLTRIGSVISGRGDVLLLMEGTNDISRDIPPEATLFNLNEMARRAENRGWQVVHATLIPRLPNARFDPENIENQDLCQRIRNLAGLQSRRLVDPFEVFGVLPDLYASFYSADPEDPVGHPNAAGYDELAEAFFNVLTDVDRVPPVVGLMSPANGAQGVAPDSAISLDVWDFGQGLQVAQSSVLIEGTSVPVAATGDSLKGEVRFQPADPLSGIVTVRLRARDQAGNQVDRQVSRFIIAGTSFLTGDINQDGRVDGADLVRMAVHFGALGGQQRYERASDLNSDGVIDGNDLAQLAASFGQSL